MENIPRLETTSFLDRLPVRVSAQCLREKNYIHMHRHIQVCYVRSGTLRHTINGKEYIQNSGSCSVILPYMKHMTDLTESEDTPVVVFISFIDSFLSDFGYRFFPFGGELASFEDRMIPAYCEFSEENRETARGLILNMMNEFSLKREMSFERLASLIAELFRIICTDAASEKNIQLVEERAEGIKRATEYIDRHFAEKISIDDLCPIAGMSRSTFTVNFKAITGLTVANFILARRLTSAIHLLYNPDKLLDDIASQTGLHNRTNLTRVLRKHMGISPTELRQQHFSSAPINYKKQFSVYEWLNELETLE